MVLERSIPLALGLTDETVTGSDWMTSDLVYTIEAYCSPMDPSLNDFNCFIFEFNCQTVRMSD